MSPKRKTLQRQIILDTIKSLSQHPSADDLYLEIHKNHPVVGKSTVYRNLRHLADEGVISQISVDGVIRYDKNTHTHCHFICETCKNIFDIEITQAQYLNEAVFQKYGFTTNRHEIEFFGVCFDCNKY